MEKNGERKVDSIQHMAKPFKSASFPSNDIYPMNECTKSTEIEELDDANCPVCMEYPHNAVLLVCTSYNKGCRPYICATGHLHSNCLKQFIKGHKNVTEIKCKKEHFDFFISTMGAAQLLCPLCRGKVKGWTVEDEARIYFDSKGRTCMQEKCSYVGNYQELKKHIKSKHPRAKTQIVDPVRVKKWKKLERKREREDVICAVQQSIPGAIVVGDYVMEPPLSGFFGFVRRCLASLKSFNVRNNGASHNRSSQYLDNTDYTGHVVAPPATTNSAVAPVRSFRGMLCWRQMRQQRH